LEGEHLGGFFFAHNPKATPIEARCATDLDAGILASPRGSGGVSGRAEAFRKEAGSPEAGALKTFAKHGQAVHLRDLLVGKFIRKDSDDLQRWAEIGHAAGDPNAPTMCYSNPSNGAEFKDYLRDSECKRCRLGTDPWPDF
jgi:hypothetical protein